MNTTSLTRNVPPIDQEMTMTLDTTIDTHTHTDETVAAPAPLESDNTTDATGSVTLRNVVRAEWIKFRSVRSLVVTLAAAAVTTVGFGMIFSATAGSDEVRGPAAFVSHPVEIALGSITLTQLIVGVIGVLVVAGEYSTGLIRTTIAAVGRRGLVLRAKTIVVGAVAAITMGVTALVAVLAGQAVYGGSEATMSLSDPALWQAIGGTTVYLAGVALIGVALAFILRSTAGAIGALVGGLMIGPGLLQLLPDGFTEVVLKYLPSEAGSAMMSVVTDPDLLSTGPAYAVFIAWVAGFLGVAAWRLRSQDA